MTRKAFFFSPWQKQTWNSVYLSSLNWPFAFRKWTFCANYRKNVGRRKVGRAETTILGMANTFLSEDWHSGDLHSAHQQGISVATWKWVASSLGKQEGIYEAVLDASEALSKGGSEARNWGASMTSLFLHHSLETIVPTERSQTENHREKQNKTKLFRDFSLRVWVAEEKHEKMLTKHFLRYPVPKCQNASHWQILDKTSKPKTLYFV